MAALGESRALEALEELAKRMKRKFARGAAGTRTAPAAARSFLVLLWRTLCTAVSPATLTLGRTSSCGW